MLTLMLLFLFVAVAGALWWQGLWTNLLLLANVLFAALFASNYFEPAADLVESFAPGFTYLLDFAFLWVLFIGFFGASRMLTDLLSGYAAKFHIAVEMIGRTVLALWTAWVFVAFTSFTLHTAPIPADAYLGGFQPTPRSTVFFGADRVWLGFVQNCSRSALSRGWQGPEDVSSRPGDQGVLVFDPQGEFIFKYRNRRRLYEQETNFAVER